MRVLITGATGFVGANLARRLVADGHNVHALVRPGYRRWRLEGLAGVELHSVELVDREATFRVVAGIRPEWVFHLAASGAYSWQRDTGAMVATNLTSLVNLLDACSAVGFAAFVNTGSSSEYGCKDHPPTEDEWLDPNSSYAVTKAAATHYCRFIAARDQVPVPTLRLYSVYGPYEEPNRLLPQLIVHGRRGGYPPLASPEIARDYVYVDDVTEAYVRAASQRVAEPGAVYNVGSGVQTSLGEMVALAGEVFGVRTAPVWGGMANRAWDTTVWVANIDKIGRELAWRPRFSVAEGFRAMAAWFAQLDDAGLEAYLGRTNAPSAGSS